MPAVGVRSSSGREVAYMEGRFWGRAKPPRRWGGSRSVSPLPRLLLAGGLLAGGLLSCGPDGDSEPADLDGPRVVSLVPSLSELMITLGVGRHLVARTDFDTHPDLLNLPSVGGGLDPSLEALVGLQVDRVLMPEGRDMPGLRSRFEELGMEVEVIPTNTISELFGAIHRLGEIFQVSVAADSLTRSLREATAEIEERLQGRAPVPILYVVGIDPAMTTGGSTFLDDLIRIAGGRNVFSGASVQWPTVGFESIVDRDPQVVVWPQAEFRVEGLEALQAMPGWRDIPAVKAGRVVFVDGYLFNRPGPGFPVAARILAEALHPDAFVGQSENPREGGS